MSFITTKFQEILLSGFRGVALTNCFSSIFHFGQMSKFKKGVIPRKKWIKITCVYAHLHGMSFTAKKFHEILLSGFREVALTNCFSNIFHFGQISKLRKGRNFERKKEIKIELKFPVEMRICTLYKVSRNLLSGFRGVALTRKTGDWLKDGSKTVYPSQLGTIYQQIRNVLKPISE